MVFIGSRSTLQRFGSDFKNVWISFIRNFNRLKHDGKALPDLCNQIEVLANLILRWQKKTAPTEIENASISLWTDLDHLQKQLTAMKMNAAAPKTISPAAFSAQKKTMAAKIKHAKQIIALLDELLREEEETKNLTEKQKSRRQFFMKSGDSLLLMLLGGSSLAAGELLERAQRLPLKKKEGLAILISYGENSFVMKAIGPLQIALIPLYVARLELAFGQKANIIKRAATSKDLFDVLVDDTIQHLVIFGHGSWSSWVATDRPVVSEELWDQEFYPKLKKGYLLRHTCGGGREIYSSESEVIVNPKKWSELQGLVDLINRSIYPDNVLVFDSISFAEKDYVVASGFHLFFERAQKGKRIEPSVEQGGMDSISMYAVKDLLPPSTAVEIALKRFPHIKPHFDADPDLKIALRQIFELISSFIRNKKPHQSEKPDLFGLPIFERENIKGWARLTFTGEFIINPFGDKTLDRFYYEK